MFTTILCCLVNANATLASRTDSLDNFCCTVNNSASLLPMKPRYSERTLVELTFNVNDHTGWWWLGKTTVSWTNEQQASAISSVRKATYKRKNDRRDTKKEKKDRKSRIMARKDNIFSPRLPQSGPDTSVDLLPPAHVFFLDMFFFLGLISWRSTSHLRDAHRRNGTQIPMDW